MHPTRTIACGGALLASALFATPSVDAGTFTVELPEFERLYGGFVGDTFQATTFDFGMAFATVTSVTLHLDGFTDIPDSTASFNVELEGLPTPQVDLFVVGPPPIFPPYEIDIPLAFDGNVLDGMGDITMDVNTAGPGADLSTTVLFATLTIEGTVIPAPPALALLMLGLARTRRRR